MTNNDEILRAYSLLIALKANVPDTYELEERWIKEYHNALAKIERATGKDLADFRLSTGDLRQSVATANCDTGELTYSDGLYCERSFLLQKLDAILTYFTESLQSNEKKIGFQ